MTYHYSKTLSASMEDATERVVRGLKEEGFGVLTEIDVKRTLKEKLGVDFRPYRILGACNPTYAHQALLHEDKIGTMLPCNVILQQSADGAVEVSAVNPIASMQAIANPDLHSIAEVIQRKLQTVIDRL
ncbi:MAG: DUF302 domain-containing protein [Rhodospirillaceae bacterium]|nr:DUF302 domain-containing protein [Rhodospirillaceae bacterium]